VLIMMIAYLVLSLVTSAVMNVVNARMALVER
jgi:general L-amino acid transport system permease protein